MRTRETEQPSCYTSERLGKTGPTQESTDSPANSPDTESSLPTHIKIGPLYYKLVSNYESILKRQRESATNGLVGHIDFVDEVITMVPNISRESQVVCLFHEILHALFESRALLHEDVEAVEELVTTLAFGMASVVLDNPDLITWMLETS